MSLNTFLLIDGGLMILGLPLFMILKVKSSHKIGSQDPSDRPIIIKVLLWAK